MARGLHERFPALERVCTHEDVTDVRCAVGGNRASSSALGGVAQCMPSSQRTAGRRRLCAALYEAP